VGGAGRGRAQEVQDEVPIGDGVHRVGRDAVEAELGGDRRTVGGEVHPRERPRAQRGLPGLARGEREAVTIAQKHPDVGEQVMDRYTGWAR